LRTRRLWLLEPSVEGTRRRLGISDLGLGSLWEGRLPLACPCRVGGRLAAVVPCRAFWPPRVFLLARRRVGASQLAIGAFMAPRQRFRAGFGGTSALSPSALLLSDSGSRRIRLDLAAASSFGRVIGSGYRKAPAPPWSPGVFFPRNSLPPLCGASGPLGRRGRYLVDPASSHMLVSKIKPCMSKYKQSIQ
jgi:hypothetical protein